MDIEGNMTQARPSLATLSVLSLVDNHNGRFILGGNFYLAVPLCVCGLTFFVARGLIAKKNGFQIHSDLSFVWLKKVCSEAIEIKNGFLAL